MGNLSLQSIIICFSSGFQTTAHPVPAASRSVVYLVLQRAVLALRLLTDDDQVQVVVAGAVARQAVYMNHISKQVQFAPGEWKRRQSYFYKKIY